MGTQRLLPWYGMLWVKTRPAVRHTPTHQAVISTLCCTSVIPCVLAFVKTTTQTRRKQRNDFVLLPHKNSAGSSIAWRVIFPVLLSEKLPGLLVRRLIRPMIGRSPMYANGSGVAEPQLIRTHMVSACDPGGSAPHLVKRIPACSAHTPSGLTYPLTRVSSPHSGIVKAKLTTESARTSTSYRDSGRIFACSAVAPRLEKKLSSRIVPSTSPRRPLDAL